MQWSAAPYAGFSVVPPWLPVAADFHWCNVDAQRNDAASMLSLYRRLIVLRRRHPALSIGRYAPLELGAPADSSLFCYQRHHEGERFAVLLNLTDEPQRVSLPAGLRGGRLVISTDTQRAQGEDPPAGAPLGGELQAELTLAADEGVLVSIRAGAPALP
jgi:alpha-glucosidase